MEPRQAGCRRGAWASIYSTIRSIGVKAGGFLKNRGFLTGTIYCAHMYAGTGAGHKIAAVLGATGIPIINIENACSSGTAAMVMARQALLSGEHDTVVAVGIEKMPRGFMDMDYFDFWRQRIGHAVNPA